MATDKELSDFLKSVEKRAWKRAVYAVRDEDAALDIVQDTMIRLSEKYADRPAAEAVAEAPNPDAIIRGCTTDSIAGTGPTAEPSQASFERHHTRLTRAREGAPMVFRQRNSQR